MPALFTPVLIITIRVPGIELMTDKYLINNEINECLRKKLENPKYSKNFIEWRIVRSIGREYANDRSVCCPSTGFVARDSAAGNSWGQGGQMID